MSGVALSALTVALFFTGVAVGALLVALSAMRGRK